MKPERISLAPDTELAHALADAAGEPVIVEANGVRYQMTPEDPFAFYDPAKVRAAVHTSAGILKRAGVNGEQLLRDIDRGRGLRYDDVREMVREAKPATQPTEYGEETRYGRDSHNNARYNATLDEYEQVLLERLARHEAGE